MPIVADIHFHYKRAIEAAEAGAACLRINPAISGPRNACAGGEGAKDHGCSMRIGVQCGILGKGFAREIRRACPEAMVESGCGHMRLLEDMIFTSSRLSVKLGWSSSPLPLSTACRDLRLSAPSWHHRSRRHDTGTVKSSIGMGMLLWAGIGDTSRVSLSAEPEEEIRVVFDILKSLGLRHRGVNIVSCPSARARLQRDQDRGDLEEEPEAHRAPCRVDHRLRGQRSWRGARNDMGFTGGGAGDGMVILNGKPVYKLDNASLIAIWSSCARRRPPRSKEAHRLETARSSVHHVTIDFPGAAEPCLNSS